MYKLSTPIQRAFGSAPRSLNRTAGTKSAKTLQTPSHRRPLRLAPAKRGSPTTPHVIRALQQRRAAATTPGRDRRRSGRLQRETPRDMLRNLSKGIATKQLIDYGSGLIEVCLSSCSLYSNSGSLKISRSRRDNDRAIAFSP